MSITMKDRERRCIFRECDTDTSDPSRWRYLTLATKKQLSQARQEFDVYDDVDSPDDLRALFICARHRDRLDKIIFKNGACSEQYLCHAPLSSFLCIVAFRIRNQFSAAYRRFSVLSSILHFFSFSRPTGMDLFCPEYILIARVVCARRL